MKGKKYKILQRTYPTDNLLETNLHYWNQDLKELMFAKDEGKVGACA
jgi:hypothetical protein